MSIWAIIPVKPLRQGKSRLSGVLSVSERAQLNHSMLGHTLKVLSEVKQLSQILVVSRDPAALALARDFHARTLLEDGTSQLNTALKRAAAVAKAYSAEGVLVIPADLPLLEPDDIREVIARASRPPVMVINPDRRQTGTNALLIRPAGVVDFSFGAGSFTRHCERAGKLNVPVEVIDLPRIALDLDVPDDLEYLQKFEADKVDAVLHPAQSNDSYLN